MFSSLIKTLKIHRSDVHMSVPIENIARIYHWANLIVHHGFRDYGWTQPRVLSYLQPMLVGGRTENGVLSINSGIQIDRITFEKIHQELNNEVGPDYEVDYYPPEICTVVLKSE